MGKKLWSRSYYENKSMINIERQKLLGKYDVTISTEKHIKYQDSCWGATLGRAQKLSMGGGGMLLVIIYINDLS